jgi:anti-sigma regulatory factor (Ser/Thr protein kinase)
LISDLTDAGVYDATACDVGLVVSELISNSLRHATPLPGCLLRVSWGLTGDCVEVAVSDGGGPTAPTINRPSAHEIGGRGLGIVDKLALRWGVHTPQDGTETTVWAAVPLHGDADLNADARAKDGRRDRNGSGPQLVIALLRGAINGPGSGDNPSGEMSYGFCHRARRPGVRGVSPWEAAGLRA